MPAMALLRMLPTAWIASLYAALVLVLLVFFLNPALPIWLLLIATLLPMALWVSLAGALIWPLGYRFLRVFARRRLRVRWFSFRYLLGFAGANLFVVAGLYWYNADLLEAVIPENIVLRLRGAAALLTASSLAFLATALLRKWRGRFVAQAVCGGAGALLPLLLLGARGVASVPQSETYTPELVAPPSDAPRLLVMGIEGATLDQILPLVAQGKLPSLGKLLQQGAHGRLASFRPCVSSATWESLLTGKLPFKHRLLDTFRYALPLGAGEIRLAPRGFFFHRLARISGFSIQEQSFSEARALTWIQILDRLGYPSSLIAATDSAAAGGDEVALDRFMNPDVPTPPETRPLREELRRALREDTAVGEAALAAWRDPRVRALAFLLPGLDRVSHRFLRFAMPASFGDVPRAEVEKYGQVLESYYRYLDEWIGRFLAVTAAADSEAPTLTLVVSPHGIEPLPLGRRLLLALEGDRFESGYHDHAPDGLMMIAGPGVAHGKPLGKASVLDVTPTLLYYLRLPVGKDMDGHPLTRLFQDASLAGKPLLLIPSYERSRVSARPHRTAASP